MHLYHLSSRSSSILNPSGTKRKADGEVRYTSSCTAGQGGSRSHKVIQTLAISLKSHTPQDEKTPHTLAVPQSNQDGTEELAALSSTASAGVPGYES